MKGENCMDKKSALNASLKKRARVQFIAECYCKTQHSLNHHSQIRDEVIREEVGESKKEKEEYVTRVKSAYGKLDRVNQMFINKEFFFEDYPYWWTKIYSRATFYRLKSKAIDSFLRNFDAQI